jgi:hypothetical protein
MEIRIILDDHVARNAGEKARAAGISLEQAVSTYIHRIAEGTEPVENEFLPDGKPGRRTLRQQIYRLGA